MNDFDYQKLKQFKRLSLKAVTIAFPLPPISSLVSSNHFFNSWIISHISREIKHSPTVHTYRYYYLLIQLPLSDFSIQKRSIMKVKNDKRATRIVESNSDGGKKKQSGSFVTSCFGK